MIISKAALGVATVAGKDTNVPILNSVCIEPSGEVVATNGLVLCVVSPVSEKMRNAVPLEPKEPMSEQVVLTAEAIKTVIKAMPRDTQFKGLLEHCAMRPEGTDKVKVVVTNGRSNSEMTLRRMAEGYPDYRAVLRKAAKDRCDGNSRTILNRKRMDQLVKAMSHVCPYHGKFSPVYWEFTKGGNIIVRAKNELTGQRMLSVFSTMHATAERWMEWDEWEERICGMETITEEKCPTCGNRMAKDWGKGGAMICSFVDCPSRKQPQTVPSVRKAFPLAQKHGAVKLQ